MIKKLSRHTPIILLALLLTPGGELPAQEEKAQGGPATVATEDPAADSEETASPAAQGGKTPEDFKAGKNNSAPDFKIYVFLAYGLTCLLLFLFFIWNIIQGRKLGKRIDYLEERFSQGPGDQAAR
jgi:hypothetical protein